MAFFSDLRVAFRTLLRAPGLFALATLVLGVGVASVASMFGALRLTFTDPPLERTDRVFSLMTVDRVRNDLERWVPLHDLQEVARQQTSFESVAGWLWDAVALRREGGVAERCVAARVTGPFFGLLRIQPLLGRNLLAEDARPGAAPVVVISERLWRSAFAADPAIVGQSVRLNGEPVTVVGVAPAALDIPISARVWIPDRSDTSKVPRADGPWFHPLGRLKDGVTPDAARAELRAIHARRVVRYPETVSEVPDVRPFSTVWLGIWFSPLVRVLFGSVLLVLVLACVNVAGLLLVRAAGRTHEAAVRRALGAGRLRLAGQLLAESAIIGVAAALVAVVLEEAGLELIRRVPALESAPNWWRFRLDLPMAAVIFSAAAAATLGASLYPAIRTARVSIDPVLREGQRDTGLHAARLVRWLIVAEIALSSALLSAAGLVIRSAATLGRGDVGAPTAGWLQARIDLPRGRYDGPGMARFIEGVGRALQAIPGVRATAITTAPPGIPSHWPEVYQLADRPGRRLEELPSANLIVVSAGYFESVQIPLVSGRGIATADVYETQRVAVVSESLARSAWPGGDAVGRQIRIGAPEQGAPWMTVVGVARDVRYDEKPSTLETTPPIIYLPLAQWPREGLYALVRGTGDPLALAAGVREAARLEPDLAVHSIRTLDEERQRNATGFSILGYMFTEFGIITLLLAAAGVYGVLAYSVAQGARELAIRRALGAPDRLIVATVLARAGWQLVLGLAVGVVLVPVMGTLVGSVLGQRHHPFLLYLEVAAALSLTLLVAVLVPLRRALAQDPAAALHHT